MCRSVELLTNGSNFNIGKPDAIEEMAARVERIRNVAVFLNKVSHR